MRLELRRASLRSYVWFIVAILAAACMQKESGKHYIFDLSTPEKVMAFEFPGNVSDSQEYFADTQGPKLTLVLPGDRTFERRLSSLFLSRFETVLEVSAQLERATVDEATRQARELMRDWEIPTGQLETWYSDAKDGRHHVTFAASRALSGEQSVGIEILHSFDPNRPWFVQFSFGAEIP